MNRAQPILRVAGTSCDRKRESEFPSVYGEEGNLVLLSQSFDDNAVLGQFRPPDGTDLVGWINDLDEVSALTEKNDVVIQPQSKHTASLTCSLIDILGWIFIWEEAKSVRSDR